jgi:hypothetical protein
LLPGFDDDYQQLYDGISFAMAPPKVPQSGVWCPAVTSLSTHHLQNLHGKDVLTRHTIVFDPETDTLDLESQAKYYSYLSRSGLTGLVILGTNAEAFLLTVRPTHTHQISLCSSDP